MYTVREGKGSNQVTISNAGAIILIFIEPFGLGVWRGSRYCSLHLITA